MSCYFNFLDMWCRSVMVITTAHLYSTKPEMFCAGSNPANGELIGSLTMILSGNKTKRFSLVNHTTKTICSSSH